jgi:MFS family permease
VAFFTLMVVRSNLYVSLFALMLLMHVAYALWLPNYALIRDTVPLERRGRISGLANITSTLGIMLGHVLSPRFIELKQMLRLALIAVSANILSNLWVALGIKENRPANEPVQNISSWKEIYLPKLDGASNLKWLAAVNLLTQMGSVAMLCFLLYFIKDQLDRVHFNETFRNVYLIATVAAVVSSLVAGMVADLFGRKQVLIAACVLQIACMLSFLLLPWVHSTLYLGGFLFGAGNGAYWSIYWTMLSDMVPEGETSKYIGLIQYTSIIPWALVPAVLGPIVDNFGAASGRGYKILFIVIVLLLGAGVLLIRQLPETLKRESKVLSEDVGVE